MKTIYHFQSEVTGRILIRRRKIAKSLRWWLRENGLEFTYGFTCS